MQDPSKWVLGKKLGAGCSGTVWAVDSDLYPNVVLKKGNYDHIYEEAERLSLLSHPNVEKVFAFVDPKAQENGHRVGYMAVERLGPSLQAIKDSGKV